MALAAAGRVVVAGRALDCAALEGLMMQASPAERIAIPARRSCIAVRPLRECFASGPIAVARARGVQPRALATNYLEEEESNVSEVQDPVNDVVEAPEATTLTPSAFEVRIFNPRDYLLLHFNLSSHA